MTNFQNAQHQAKHQQEGQTTEMCETWMQWYISEGCYEALVGTESMKRALECDLKS